MLNRNKSTFFNNRHCLDVAYRVNLNVIETDEAYSRYQELPKEAKDRSMKPISAQAKAEHKEVKKLRQKMTKLRIELEKLEDRRLPQSLLF